MSDNDYFPTPEPLALAMVRLLIAHTKESPLAILEPSPLGHTMVEPSTSSLAPVLTFLEMPLEMAE